MVSEPPLKCLVRGGREQAAASSRVVGCRVRGLGGPVGVLAGFGGLRAGSGGVRRGCGAGYGRWRC